MVDKYPDGATLKRRAGNEGFRTYYLDLFRLGGFVKVHTSHPEHPKQAHPDLVHLAAMVERAPELTQTLAELCRLARLGDPLGPILREAEALLSDIASFDPARQAVAHGEA